MSNVSDIAASQPEMVSDSVVQLGEKIVASVRTVFDPEIPVNIYDLGLIYKIDVKPPEAGIENGKSDVHIEMTLTTPNCPVAGSMPGLVERAVRTVEEIGNITVDLTFDPPWNKDMMSDEAKLQLNMF
jgi:FeS assembly SUF system protein